MFRTLVLGDFNGYLGNRLCYPYGSNGSKLNPEEEPYGFQSKPNSCLRLEQDKNRRMGGRLLPWIDYNNKPTNSCSITT